MLNFYIFKKPKSTIKTGYSDHFEGYETTTI